MAINLKSTNTVKMKGLKVLVYGMAGSGKTTLIKTLPAPVILSAEGGLLSISGEDLPYIEIKTMADLREAYGWLASSEEAKGFRSVALDSISEIAERTGFSDSNYFCRQFRKHYGLSPQQYRKTHPGS